MLDLNGMQACMEYLHSFNLSIKIIKQLEIHEAMMCNSSVEFFVYVVMYICISMTSETVMFFPKRITLALMYLLSMIAHMHAQTCK